MKTLFKRLITAFLLIAPSSFCFSMTEIQDVTPERAREWGVVINSRWNGDAGIRVWLELKTQEKWEKFSWIELKVTPAGERLAPALASAPLAIGHPTPDTISTVFSAQPSTLKECEIWIHVNDIKGGGSAYRFKVKDFVDLEQVSPRTPQKKSTGAEHGGADQPATAPESTPVGNPDTNPEPEIRPQ